MSLEKPTSRRVGCSARFGCASRWPITASPLNPHGPQYHRLRKPTPDTALSPHQLHPPLNGKRHHSPGPNDPAQQPAHAGQTRRTRTTFHRVAGLLQRIVRRFNSRLRAIPPEVYSRRTIGASPATADQTATQQCHLTGPPQRYSVLSSDSPTTSILRRTRQTPAPPIGSIGDHRKCEQAGEARLTNRNGGKWRRGSGKTAPCGGCGRMSDNGRASPQESESRFPSTRPLCAERP
jgi:hypothetical protein